MGRYILFETLPYIVSIASPNWWKAASAAIEIKEATSAYSMAFAPLASENSLIDHGPLLG